MRISKTKWYKAEKLTSHDETGEYTCTQNNFTTHARMDEPIGV